MLNTSVLSTLDGKQEVIGKSIAADANRSQLFTPPESVRVNLLKGNVNNDTVAIIIILPEEKNVNYGQQLFDFKQLVLQEFTNTDIPIDKDKLDISFRSKQYIDSLVSEARSREQTDGQNTTKAAKSAENESSSDKSDDNEYDYAKKAEQFTPVEPQYSFNRVILPKDVIRKIEEAIAILECENKVFKEWGLYEIQPHPSTSLSFYGSPGTGKTMAAEAVAEKLGKKILKVSYADVESKYHGEGPKMVKAIFLAAEKNDAVLFFDEADSLLSKRLTNVSQGSEQAINSMRSQLLICLEEFKGIVIFATNLVINYDKAFLTRLISVEFPIPDAETRKQIWDVHIRPVNDGKRHQLNIPLSEDVNTTELAEKYDFVGREIRNAVVGACVSAAMEGREYLFQADFITACDNILKERNAIENAKDHTAQASKEQAVLKAALMSKLSESKEEKDNVSTSSE
jgi:ATP-dependent 26S proteasome regulatory subunit